MGYERIDPGYRTLGAYYFTNDLENITLNLVQTMFGNKLALSVNTGMQRDDLDNKKSSTMTRMVASINANYRPGERLNVNLTYSNFQSYSNIKTYYQRLTEVSKYDNLDTLDFTQISQNANLNVNWIIKKSKVSSHNLNINITFQDANDHHDDPKEQLQTDQNSSLDKGITSEETLSTAKRENKNSSQFFNTNAVYSVLFPSQRLSLSGAMNYSYSTIGLSDAVTWGPSIAIRKKFLDNKLNTAVSYTYNLSNSQNGVNTHITSIRANAGYLFRKRHNFNLSCVALHRKRTKKSTDFTATLAYSYSF